jgi:hypothetical protein
VPGGVPSEPCEAWWLQADDLFVDVRVATPGNETNQLPFSSTRAFAGRFEIADGQVRWHLSLDSLGLAPRTDAADATGLYRCTDDPKVLIEDAAGRFREEWVDHGDGHAEVVLASGLIGVRIGTLCGAVWSRSGATCGRVWRAGGQTFAAVGHGAGRGAADLPDHWGWS